jgi:hypothetical protein
VALSVHIAPLDHDRAVLPSTPRVTVYVEPERLEAVTISNRTPSVIVKLASTPEPIVGAPVVDVTTIDVTELFIAPFSVVR